jgi:inner membrane transporter RhtA
MGSIANATPKRADEGHRRRAAAGGAMIFGTSLSIQLAAGVGHHLFARLSPPGVSSLRFFLGALVLGAVVRPSLRGRAARTWRAVGAYGVSLAALNLSYFEAISLIPLGIAVTIGFVPPLLMALVSSRRRLDVVWILLAGGGVAILSGIDRPRSILGIVCAMASGVAWLGVAYSGRVVGEQTRRVDGLALALPLAAVVTLPFGIDHVNRLDPGALGLGLVIAVGGLIVPFTLELEGLRRLEPRAVAVIYSIDPANAAIVGLLFLGQHLTVPQALGTTGVIVASAGATLTAAERSVERKRRQLPKAVTEEPAPDI